MTLPMPPEINQGEIALDPTNGIVYYKDSQGNLISTTWSWLRGDLSAINTDDDVTITGNLTVSGTTVSVNVESVTVADNILILNSNVTASPTENAGIEVERGTSPNVSIRWNESTDKWQVTEDGTNYYDILSTNTASVVTLTGEQTLTNKTLTSPIITGISPTITLSGDLSGSVTLTNFANGTLDATIAANSVALGADTTGNYVSSLAAGTGVTISNPSGEGVTPNISIGQSVGISDTVTFNTVNASLIGNVTGTVSSLSNHSIDALSDVAISGAANGDFLRYNGSNWINDPVNLTTDTVGDYVSKLSAGTGITITNNSGEGATPNISFSGSINDLSDLTITSAQNGQILEYDGTNWVNTVRPSSEPIGHENKADSVISFDEGSRQFSIAPVSTSYTVWCTGKRYVKTTTESVTIPDASGLYYIYFNSSGSLAYKTTYFTWDQDTPTAYIYWNDIDNKAYFFADERHGVTLDWATHEYLHRTRGAAIANGFGANNYTLVGDGSLDAHAKIDIANGTFFDEDLQVDIEHASSPTANTWQQRLQSGAYIPVFYRLNNHWKKDVATQFAIKNSGTRAEYNLTTGGNWTTTSIDNSKYGVMFVVATNNLNEPIISIMGQDQYTDQGSAEASTWDELNLDGFPIVEFRPLYKIVFQTANAYANTPKTKFVNLLDLRQIISSGAGGSATAVSDHGSMTGLADDDHTQYLTDARHNVLDHSTAMSSVVLNDIGDVQAATPSSDQVLAWDSTGSRWVSKTFSASVASLDAIGDVDYYTPPVEGHVLKFDGTNWSHFPDNAGTTINSLDDISDVAVASATPNQFLKFDGSDWVNETIELGTNTIGNYLSNVTAGTGVSITHTPGEGSSAQIAIGQPIGTGATPSFTGVTAGKVTIGIPKNGSVNNSIISSTVGYLYVETAQTEGGQDLGLYIQPGLNLRATGHSNGQGVQILGGAAESVGSGNAYGGNVLIIGGAAYGGPLYNEGGDVEIDGGIGNQTNGSVLIGTNRAEAITIGRSDKITTVAGNMEVSGTMSFQQTTEKVNTSSITSNVMTCDYTTGAIYYQSTNPSANFTANFTNVPTTNNKAITFTIFVTQGINAYLPNAVQIDGSAQTIKWAQGTTPTPTANKIDIFSFTLIRLSNTWTVFGNANTNF